MAVRVPVMERDSHGEWVNAGMGIFPAEHGKKLRITKAPY